MSIAKMIYLKLCLWMPSQHANIAVKQAILESGWFKSEAYTQLNNPFGLMWKGSVQCFESVDEACYQYYRQIYCQYDSTMYIDYYDFLDGMYCPGCTNYISTVKSIHWKND